MSGRFFVLIAALAALLLPGIAGAQLYTESQTLTGGFEPAERFGSGVAVSGDTLAVAALTDRAVHVFVRNGGTWTLQQTIPGDYYGFNGPIALDGDTLVIAGKIYERMNGAWTLTATAKYTDAVTVQGDTVVTGMTYNPDQPMSLAGYDGFAEVLVRDGTTWTQQADFRGSDKEGVGQSVAIDGDTLVLGVNNGYGGARIYVRSGAAWVFQGRLGWQGVGMAAVEGDTIAVAKYSTGEVNLFTRSGNSWSLTQALTMPAHSGNYQGVAISGGILAVTAREWVFTYARTASGWVLAQSFALPGARTPSVALTNHGKLCAVGSTTDTYDGASTHGFVQIHSTPPPPAPGSGWQDVDVGAVGVAGSSSISGDAGEVRGSGADIWGAGDQFHFRSETLTGDGAIIARVTSAGGGHPWAKVGLMFREDVAPASRNVMALVTPGGRVGLQARAATLDTTTFVEKWGGAPVWLMLARTGDVFDAFRSNDGENWTPIGSSTVEMPPTIHVGLAVSSHNNAVLNTGTFAGIELVGTEPPPSDTLVGLDLGTVAVAGMRTEADGTVTIDAAGSDIWGTADSGYFAHREITGDFDLRARITSLTNTHAWAKAGVMVRESLAPGSRNLFTLLTAANAAGLQVRSTTGGATTWAGGPWVRAPYWVRLVRTGDNFQAFLSADGTTWQPAGTAVVALPATVHAGLAVSSHVANTATRATVTSLEFGAPAP